MSALSSQVLRFQFLLKMVNVEAVKLNGTWQRLFAEPFNQARALQLKTDDLFAERVEAFVSRFCRLQDTLGDKLIPVLLDLLGERNKVMIDNLDIAERLELIPSADEWMAIRQLRNQMIHEYIEDLTILVNALQAAQAYVPHLLVVVRKINNEAKSRAWL